MPGRYRLAFEKSGYFTEEIADVSVGSSEFVLGKLLMTAKRTISGTVRWQNGDPAYAAQVQLLSVQGTRLSMPLNVSPIRTNDRGVFEFVGLRPGRYILHVTPPGTRYERDVTFRSAIASAAALAVPVFYPNSTTLEPSLNLDLWNSKEATNLAVGLEEVAGGEIQGTVSGPLLPAGADITLQLLTPSGSPLPFSTKVKAGEPFRMAPAPQGLFLLEASANLSSGTSRVLQPISIGAEPLRNLGIVMVESAVIAGTVAVEDGATAVPVQIQAQADRFIDTGFRGLIAPDVIVSYGHFARPDARGIFQIRNVIPGETYFLRFAGLPQNAYVSAVTQGLRDASGDLFRVVAREEPVRVSIRQDAGQVSGHVRTAGLPSRAFVVVAPRDRTMEHRFFTAWSNIQGAFEFAYIPPGDYQIFAFDRPKDQFDLALLQAVENRATTVTVMPVRQHSVEVQLISR